MTIPIVNDRDPRDAQMNDMANEIHRLRAALLPFAKIALTRNGQAATSDDMQVLVTMGQCRAAQRAMSE